MPWADHLYMLSYLSVPNYGSGTGLYEIDEDLKMTKIANHSSVFVRISPQQCHLVQILGRKGVS